MAAPDAAAVPLLALALAMSRPPCPSAAALSCSPVRLTLRFCLCAVPATTNFRYLSQHILHLRPQHGFRFPEVQLNGHLEHDEMCLSLVSLILFLILPLARRQSILLFLPFSIALAFPFSSTFSTVPASVLQLHVHPGLRRTVYCPTLLPIRRVPTCCFLVHFDPTSANCRGVGRAQVPTCHG